MKGLKKIAIYGDSISTINHGEGGYEQLLKQSLELEVIYNFAVGSSGLAEQTPNSAVSILKQKEKIPKDVDLFLIWHGTNDWYWGTEIGTMEDKMLSTYWGAIDFTIKQLREAAFLAQIIWLTPIYRKELPYQGTKEGEAYECKNRKGYTLFDYYKTLEQASKRYGFALIDMRRFTNIHKENADYFLEDEVHPNKQGYQVIHAILDREIKRLYV